MRRAAGGVRRVRASGVPRGLLILIAVCLIGCSDGRLALAPVSGRVTVAGKPLPAGRIIFQPEAGRGSFGRIEDGQILDVMTYVPGDGVPIGRQRVAIVPEIDEQVAMTDPYAYARSMRASSIPSRFHQTSSSQLVADIMPGQKNELQFDLPSE